VRGGLHDGTAFEVAIEQDLKRKEKAKRKYRKVRERIAEEASIALRLDPQVYPNLESAAAGLAGTPAPDGIAIRRADLTDGVLRVKATLGGIRRERGRYGVRVLGDRTANGARLLGLLAFIYRGLAQASPAAAPPSPEPPPVAPGPGPGSAPSAT